MCYPLETADLPETLVRRANGHVQGDKMQVRVKLMGMLKKKTPPNEVLELPDGATLEEAVQALGIRLDSAQVFTVNGQLERNRSRSLADHDELTILPPVAGG
jgi:molybdopterin converting factor small subunit